MPPLLASFLPAIIAVITDLVVAVIVRSQQPGLPSRFVLFQVVMLGAALLIAIPSRWVRVVAFVPLIGGVILGLASVGLLYVPTVVAAGWVMAQGNENSPPSFLDTEPQRGIIYTESELEAMRDRHGSKPR